ncbi:MULTISPECIES: DUF4393 domain-containing protein [Limosilactobacillus]|uniref:DUF4393 domain-containing protein n=1 Tax=Limosilactobacillus TaxID=2742598 RepID=UPI00242C5356|nr:MULTISPECIES: DUF4393 domain-containing protein [Limosilactobacillus]MCI6852833.1 DUF4393 domain-containing protein [Limosilactobacillus vaginalis]MDY4865635.1 DUF4393 domain-containing protein [Limosilactobacillus sp.]
MDPNLIIGTGIDVYNSLPGSTQEALLNPAAKTLGEALDGAATVICSPLLMLGTVSKVLLHKFSTEINQKINGIPQSNRDTSKLGLVIKAMEEARYQLTEDDVRSMYVNLIASTVDSRKNSVVNPRLATVVAQFGIKEAHIMKKLAQSESKLLLTSQLWEIDGSSDYWITPRFLSIDNELTSEYASSIDTLKSLGVVDDFPDRVLTETKYKEEYSDMEKYIKGLNQLFRHQEKTTRFKNGYIKLSNFGNDLARCIFE